MSWLTKDGRTARQGTSAPESYGATSPELPLLAFAYGTASPLVCLSHFIWAFIMDGTFTKTRVKNSEVPTPFLREERLPYFCVGIYQRLKNRGVIGVPDA